MDKNKSMHLKYFIPINAPSDAPTPETDAAEMCPMSIPQYEMAVPSSTCRRLERERDEARAELAQKTTDLQECVDIAWGVIANAGGGDWNTQSFEWVDTASRWRDKWVAELDKLKTTTQPSSTPGRDCPNCNNQGWYIRGNQNEEPTQEQCQWCYTVTDSKFNLANTPPTEGSAVEWVKSRLGQYTHQVLCDDDALELARRADEAERSAQHWEQARNESVEAHEALWEKHGITKAQLAAAQAEARELREALEKMFYLCEHDLGMDEESPYVELARAALAKKEGAK